MTSELIVDGQYNIGHICTRQQCDAGRAEQVALRWLSTTLERCDYTFGELTDFMSSAPCVVMVLEAEGAIKKWRDLMGATNPAEAAEGSLRKEFGTSIGENATHGSDAPETAAFEIPYFFSGLELL
jgi:nucleoside diphosphate kinase